MEGSDVLDEGGDGGRRGGGQSEGGLLGAHDLTSRGEEEDGESGHG